MKHEENISAQHAQCTCTFRPNPEGGYAVRCPAFPGLISSGKDLEEARAMAREALELCIEAYQQQGWALPEPDAVPRKTIKELIPVKLARVGAASLRSDQRK
jgi:predicted RNase H-like HicB family nuclease